jgi:hypothetical protein
MQERRQNSLQLQTSKREKLKKNFFPSFRALGIPGIVDNGEIKNSFSHPKRRALRKEAERGGG